MIVKEDEKQELEALRIALRQQYGPATVTQQIGFERILVAAWRLKLATRMETRRLNSQFDLQAQQDLLAKGGDEKVKSPRWYSADRGALRIATKILSDLRQDIGSSGSLHVERYKDILEKMFGSDFYDSLFQWQPVNVTSILLAEHLDDHAKTFKRPLPELDPPRSSEAVVGDPRSRWQMMIKLVDVQLQHINDVGRLLDQGSAGGDSQNAVALDVGSRYFTSASRELERAVAWYQDLLAKGVCDELKLHAAG